MPSPLRARLTALDRKRATPLAPRAPIRGESGVPGPAGRAAGSRFTIRSRTGTVPR